MTGCRGMFHGGGVFSELMKVAQSEAKDNDTMNVDLFSGNCLVGLFSTTEYCSDAVQVDYYV